jgi:hypothetical protein
VTLILVWGFGESQRRRAPAPQNICGPFVRISTRSALVCTVRHADRRGIRIPTRHRISRVDLTSPTRLIHGASESKTQREPASDASRNCGRGADLPISRFPLILGHPVTAIIRKTVRSLHEKEFYPDISGQRRDYKTLGSQRSPGDVKRAEVL